jgi:hypothetical protein
VSRAVLSELDPCEALHFLVPALEDALKVATLTKQLEQECVKLEEMLESEAAGADDAESGEN